ncbi:putative disease resistance protein RGA3 [Rhodamnia argentea]|uniref:Disease resistance protein RGA3 n=1 Tax=Rhodamnia argentea TaxID=178133 RepID=A0A8B8N850_9MYRT|nr:putative disease resistance protein RGA3 [Rhodamnia argentea]
MAEAVLSGLATSILNSLAAEIAQPVGSSASQKIRLLYGAKDELLSLETSVQSIQALLLDAEKQQWQNDQVKLWLKRLKAVLYDIQDLLDDVATEDLRRKVTSGNKTWKEVRFFFSKSNQLALRLKVANKIEELKKKLDGIKNDREFHLEPHLSGPTAAIERRTTHSFVREEEIIGREEDKKAIIAHLLDSSSRERVSVVSIVGIGGLGKTTLARLVYNDDKVKDCFNPKLWACHGDTKNFDEYVIIKAMLKSAQDECRGDPEMMRDLQDIENKSKDQLQQLLRKVLDGKKYLLVLDDLWNEEHQAWLDLQSLLMGGSWGSKILVTTRNRSVVRATNAKSVVHDLLGLSEDKSWDLFKKIALVDGEETLNPSLKEKCRDMVKKCAGVPLAIRTIGSLLYETEENKWDGLIDRELSEIDTSERGIMEALKVSYDHLPSALKHCFAYCALFPKDHVFDKEMIIQLWMAQGFIESNEDLEKAGDRCVSHLLWRSFLEVEEVDDSTNEVKMFKMHDLMHDLASKVAGDECKMINHNEGGIDRETRHVSFAFQSSLLQNMTTQLEATNLRAFLTLTNMRTYGQEVSPIECEGIFTKIRRCRTLALLGSDFCISSSLGSRLKHLRFLDISENWSIKSLPDSITDLLNLQTLKLSGCENLKTLPRDLKKLVNLRHLLIDGCRSLTHMPRGLNQLSSLQTLSKFVVRKVGHRVPGGVGRVDELDALNKLAGSISLEKLQFLQPAPNKAHLAKKEGLRSLRLEWWSPREERDDKSESDELVVWENLRPHQNLTHLTIYGCPSRSPPSWLSSIGCLVKLTLWACRRWKYLPPLSELPSLRELELTGLDELEFVQEIRDPQQSNTACPFFPSLETLRLGNCGKLKGWWGKRLLVGEEQNHGRYDSQSSFPKLLHVHIFGCGNLNSLPLLPSVIDLVLHGSSSKVLEHQVKAVPNYSSEAALVSTSIPLSKLKELYLVPMSALDHSMLETLLPFLRNLESMSFSNCSALRSLSSGMQYLSSLQHLVIGNCEELDLSSHDDEQGTQWRSLANLRTIEFQGLLKLVELPKGIQHVTTLQSLSIDSCRNLTSLPEWIGNFSLLQDLEIIDCPSIECMPDGMQNLTSLKRLKIHGCPVLKRRCRREDGADWEKVKGIAHLLC